MLRKSINLFLCFSLFLISQAFASGPTTPGGPKPPGSCPPAPPPSLQIPGDVNQNLSISLIDAILALQVISGKQDTPNVFEEIECISVNADINSDLKIGLEEALYVLTEMAE